MDHFEVAGVLFRWSVGVRLGDGGPSQRSELGGGIQFHGAGAKWDHGLGWGEVFGGEAPDVAEELILVSVRGEDRVMESGRGTRHGGGDRRKFGEGRWKFGCTKKG